MSVAVQQLVKRVGQRTVTFDKAPKIAGHYTVVGPREGAGPLGSYFDYITQDYMYGEISAEKSERKYLAHACREALARAQVSTDQVQYFISGDLLNQIVASTFVARDLGIPYFGIFGACSTSVEGLALGAMLVDGGFAERVLVSTASHYQTAERQFRYPIEMNIQRKATNQWTVTGAGAAVLSRDGSGPRVTAATIGNVVDYGLSDVNDMGSAMAPAAAETLLHHFRDTGRTPGDYDLIVTGDLSNVGKKLFNQLVREAGFTLGMKHQDAGATMYYPQQQPGAGASGCACSAVYILGYCMKEMVQGRYQRILAIATGSLHNPLTYQQGETIPTVAHAVVIEW